jgi:hypothetical protein
MPATSTMDRWAVCTKCDRVFSYEIFGGVTTFPRGEWMVDRDHITNDFRSPEEAEAFRLAFKEGGMRAALDAAREVASKAHASA